MFSDPDNHVLAHPGSKLHGLIGRLYFQTLTFLERFRRSLMSSDLSVFEMLTSYYVTQAIFVVTKLGIVESLQVAPRTARELAAVHGVDQDRLSRVLRLLETKGVLRRKSGARFILTRFGRALLADRKPSSRAFAELNGADANWLAWERLLESVKSGKAAFQLAHGTPFFEYTKEHPAFGDVFDRAMITLTDMNVPFILRACRFGAGTVVDVGGGRGAFLAALLRKFPHLRGVLFDLPEVVSSAPPYLAESGVAPRVEIIGGSFFESMPAGHDYYILKHILHDWGDEECARILANLRRSMKPTGQLLICELLLGTKGYAMSELLDLNMMVLTQGGRERTREEFAALLERAGFRLRDSMSPNGVVHILFAEPKPVSG